MAVDAAGRRIGRPLTVGNNASLIVVLLNWIRSIAGDTPVTCAIEDGRGFARRLADGLLLAGREVVWVPTRLAAAHRMLHAAAAAKSDQIDAAAVAHAAVAIPGLDRHRIDVRVRELRVLVDYRTDLIKAPHDGDQPAQGPTARLARPHTGRPGPSQEPGGRDRTGEHRDDQDARPPGAARHDH